MVLAVIGALPRTLGHGILLNVRDPYFPFHALNLRSNPFRALTDAEWAEIVVLPPALEAAAATDRHVQVLGEQGRGKTSTLLGLAARLRRSGQRVTYEYLLEGQNKFRSVLDGLEVLALDEVQRLDARERRRLFEAAQRGLRLILGSHEDLRPAFEARKLALETITLDAPDAEHLGRILSRRLEYFTLEPGRPGVTLSSEAVGWLHETYGSDRRAIERYLYEVFQELSGPGEVTVETMRGAPRPK